MSGNPCINYNFFKSRDVILLKMNILNIYEQFVFPLNCMYIDIRVPYRPNQFLVSFIYILCPGHDINFQSDFFCLSFNFNDFLLGGQKMMWN